MAYSGDSAISLIPYYGIDCKSTGNYGVFSTDAAGRRFLISRIIFAWEGSLSGYVSPPQINVGQTGANYQDIVVSGGPVVGTAYAYSVQSFNASGPLSITPGNTLVIRVNSAGSGTTMLMSAFIEGFYI